MDDDERRHPFDEQGNMLVRSFLSATAAGGRFMWYNLVNDSTDPTVHEGNFGLFHQPIDGVAAYPPKPAAFSQALLASQVARAPLRQITRLAGGANALRFGSGESAVHVFWRSAGASDVMLLAEQPVRVTQMDGSSQVLSPREGTLTITVTDMPTFVEGVLTVNRTP